MNKALKNKKNRVYFTIEKLDLGEFSLDAEKSSGAMKVFFRRDGSGDSLTLKMKTKKNIDPGTYTMETTNRTVLEASLSGELITIPEKEYKKTGSSG